MFTCLPESLLINVVLPLPVGPITAVTGGQILGSSSESSLSRFSPCSEQEGGDLRSVYASCMKEPDIKAECMENLSRFFLVQHSRVIVIKLYWEAYVFLKKSTGKIGMITKLKFKHQHSNLALHTSMQKRETQGGKIDHDIPWRPLIRTIAT